MLEGILVVGYVIVVIVRIGEEGITVGEYIRSAQIWRRQLCLVRLLDGKHLLGIVSQVLAQFIAQVGIRVAVADNLDRLRGTDTAVVGGDNHLEVALRQSLEQLGKHRVAQPALRNTAVGTLVVGKFTHHLRFRSGMREHVDEVDYEHVQVVVLAFVVTLHKLVGTHRVVHLVIAETVFLSEPVYLGLNQRLLV